MSTSLRRCVAWAFVMRLWDDVGLIPIVPTMGYKHWETGLHARFLRKRVWALGVGVLEPHFIMRRCPRCRGGCGPSSSWSVLFLPAPATGRKRPRGFGALAGAADRVACCGGAVWGCDASCCCRKARSAFTSAGMLSGHIMPCMVSGLNAAHTASIGI